MKTMLHHIGRTPLVQLRCVGRGPPVPILAKCEHLKFCSPAEMEELDLEVWTAATPGERVCGVTGDGAGRRPARPRQPEESMRRFIER
jgi:hypothetical protein